jgi:uncharacterized protein (DUF488 family)
MATFENYSGVKIWTAGHSTRGLDEFTSMLAAHGIEAVADVRRFPASSSALVRCADKEESAGFCKSLL